MEKILSQDEVNALLRGIDNGDLSADASSADGDGWRNYDLTSNERVIRGRMPTLEIISERFARIFQVSMSALLKKIVVVNMASVELMKFNEFMKNVPLPACINVFKMDPLKGFSLLVVDPRVIYLLVDNFFGGKAQTHVKIEGRDYTPIEHRLINKVVNLCLQDIGKAWKPVYAVDVQYSRTEINPQFASIVTPTEIVIVITFDMEVDNAPGKIHVCIPYPCIEPIKDKLQAGYQSDNYEVDQKWMERFGNQLSECSLNITVELGGTVIKIKEMMNLRTGDILILDKQVDENLVAKVEGRPKFTGRPGIYRGNLAFQINSSSTK
ncbi:MAG: flagellar motor switch protein FliM [Nitrospirae bacterium]|nr:flagellar motor switch protein FliM [Nitrospirota bacterium]